MGNIHLVRVWFMMSKADSPEHLGSHWRVRVVEQVQESMFFKVLLSVNQAWSWYKYIIHVNHLQTRWSITNFTDFVQFPISTLAILDLHCLSFTMFHPTQKGCKGYQFRMSQPAIVEDLQHPQERCHGTHIEGWDECLAYRSYGSPDRMDFRLNRVLSREQVFTALLHFKNIQPYQIGSIRNPSWWFV